MTGLVTIYMPVADKGIGTFTLEATEVRRLVDTGADLGLGFHDYVKQNPEKLLDALARTLGVEDRLKDP